jgi:hypothetical protein
MRCFLKKSAAGIAAFCMMLAQGAVLPAHAEQEFDFSDGEINSIFQSANEKIISCNNLGFTIYCKKKDQYILDARHKTNFDVINALEIKPN